MYEIKENYIVDDKGKKTGVILSIQDYENLLAELEELEEIKAYDQAKAASDEALQFDKALEEIGL
jgi:PHD/YefM family antitoxin component YafN of YafNO toxin-antitoxin module